MGAFPRARPARPNPRLGRTGSKDRSRHALEHDADRVLSFLKSLHTSVLSLATYASALKVWTQISTHFPAFRVIF